MLTAQESSSRVARDVRGAAAGEDQCASGCSAVQLCAAKAGGLVDPREMDAEAGAAAYDLVGMRAGLSQAGSGARARHDELEAEELGRPLVAKGVLS